MKIILRLFAAYIVTNIHTFAGINEDILGKWKGLDPKKPNYYIEFFEDHTLDILNNNMHLAGTWLLLKDGRLKMELEFMGIKQIKAAKIEIKDNSLIFTNDHISKYKRVAHE